MPGEYDADQWAMVDEGWGRLAVDFATLFEPNNCREYVAMHHHLVVGPRVRVLDMACGSGFALELAGVIGAECAGIDASPRLVAVARDRSPQADVRVGDMQALPWDAGAFDVVTSFRGIWGTTPHALDEARGFDSPTRKIELYSERFLDAGQPPLPAYVEPAVSPRSRPDLAGRYPLVLTCTKSLFFGETQHRNIAALRKSAPDPLLEIHPDTAASRGVAAGDWVSVTTPLGSVRARAKLVASIDPGVVCGQHGWWQACPDLDLPGYPPFTADGANLNLVLAQEPADPISGSSPLRSTLCEVSLDSAVDSSV